jgi:cytochrome P450
MTRRCTKSTQVKGIDIPEDLLIAIDVLSLHYNPEYWGEVDPNVFYPLRFSYLFHFVTILYLNPK